MDSGQGILKSDLPHCCCSAQTDECFPHGVVICWKGMIAEPGGKPIILSIAAGTLKEYDNIIHCQEKDGIG